jgi:dephospho-CoA kinase
MKSFIVGVTGPIASGKTLISKYLSNKCSLYHIDADKIGHNVLNITEVKNKIFDTFPFSKNNEMNIIDRKKLSKLVFENANLLYQLNAITWPYIIKRITEDISEHPRCIIEAIGLFKSNLHKKCNRTLYITSSRDIITERLLKRGIGLEKTIQILNMQEAYFSRVNEAEFIIENNSTESELFLKIDEIFQTWE